MVAERVGCLWSRRGFARSSSTVAPTRARQGVRSSSRSRATTERLRSGRTPWERLSDVSPRPRGAVVCERPGHPRATVVRVGVDMTDQMENGSDDRFEVAVIGAGQAGLAMGYFLAREGRHFTILDAADSIGSAWRTRWDSLVLFTPRRYDSLPGLPFPGDPDGYPGRDEVISYLERVRVDLRVAGPARTPGAVAPPTPLGASSSTLELAPSRPSRSWLRPVPSRSRMCLRSRPTLHRMLLQMHSTGYRRPAMFPKEPSSSSAAATRDSR